jgi:hypothetical protein
VIRPEKEEAARLEVRARAHRLVLEALDVRRDPRWETMGEGPDAELSASVEATLDDFYARDVRYVSTLAAELAHTSAALVQALQQVLAEEGSVRSDAEILEALWPLR